MWPSSGFDEDRVYRCSRDGWWMCIVDTDHLGNLMYTLLPYEWRQT